MCLQIHIKRVPDQLKINEWCCLQSFLCASFLDVITFNKNVRFKATKKAVLANSGTNF